MFRRVRSIPAVTVCSGACLMSFNQAENDSVVVKDNYRFVHATVVFRHGARTPVFTKLPGLEHIEWNICSKAANDALPPVDVKHLNGGARPPTASECDFYFYFFKIKKSFLNTLNIYMYIMLRQRPFP
jgi:hypothetical protein